MSPLGAVSSGNSSKPAGLSGTNRVSAGSGTGPGRSAFCRLPLLRPSIRTSAAISSASISRVIKIRTTSDFEKLRCSAFPPSPGEPGTSLLLSRIRPRAFLSFEGAPGGLEWASSLLGTSLPQAPQNHRGPSISAPHSAHLSFFSVLSITRDRPRTDGVPCQVVTPHSGDRVSSACRSIYRGTAS